MGRGKVELKRIENKISRQVTFSKRRTGLIKKAKEINVLCEADVAVIIFSAKGKLFEFSSQSGMETILDRYVRYTRAQRQFYPSCADLQTQENQGSEDYPKLVNKIELLQKSLRNTMGEDLDPLSTRELHNLEQQIDTGLKRIRTKKNKVLNETISNLQKKAKALRQENNSMAKKMKESASLEEQAINDDPISSLSTLLPRASPSLVPAPSTSEDGDEEYEEGRPADQTIVPADIDLPPWMINHLMNH